MTAKQKLVENIPQYVSISTLLPSNGVQAPFLKSIIVPERDPIWLSKNFGLIKGTPSLNERYQAPDAREPMRHNHQ
jgi:hypothetical protein